MEVLLTVFIAMLCITLGCLVFLLALQSNRLPTWMAIPGFLIGSFAAILAAVQAGKSDWGYVIPALICLFAFLYTQTMLGRAMLYRLWDRLGLDSNYSTFAMWMLLVGMALVFALPGLGAIVRLLLS